MNKNISVLLAVSAMLVMMGAGCSQTSRIVNFDTNKVGDVIVGLTIASIAPASDTLPLSGDNMRVKFQGDVTVAGFYDNDTKAIGMVPPNCFTVSDPAEKQRLPALKGLDQQDSFFCFNNLDEAKKAFGSQTGKISATITVRNLELWVVPAEKANTVDFVKIVSVLPVSEKSFTEYFATREQFKNSGMQKDAKGVNKNPNELGFTELAKTEVTCPDSAGTPCSGEVLILSKDALHSGDQEFYLAQTAGFGYTYYGPFTDDLQRIVNESKSATLVAGPSGTISKTFESEKG